MKVDLGGFSGGGGTPLEGGLKGTACPSHSKRWRQGERKQGRDEWKISWGQTLCCSVIFCRKNSARLKKFTPLLYTSQISKWSSLLYAFYTGGSPKERRKIQLKVTFPNLLPPEVTSGQMTGLVKSAPRCSHPLPRSRLLFGDLG